MKEYREFFTVETSRAFIGLIALIALGGGMYALTVYLYKLANQIP